MLTYTYTHIHFYVYIHMYTHVHIYKIYKDLHIYMYIYSDCTDEDSFIVEINYETQPVFPSLSSSLFDKVKCVYISIYLYVC
jgi:hypothetical protein